MRNVIIPLSFFLGLLVTTSTLSFANESSEGWQTGEGCQQQILIGLLGEQKVIEILNVNKGFFVPIDHKLEFHEDGREIKQTLILISSALNGSKCEIVKHQTFDDTNTMVTNITSNCPQSEQAIKDLTGQ